MKKKKYNINYKRFIPFIICIILLILIIIKITSNITINSGNETLNTIQINDENVAQTDNTALNSDTIRSESESKAMKLEDGKKSNNSLPVLMYHYFYDKSKGEKGKNSNWMEISKFSDQLKYLKANDYYFPTWDEVSDFVDGKVDLPKKSVVITIDDGHESLYKLAIPELDKYKIPATAFIITKNFDTSNLEKYKNSTIDFESHTDNMHRPGGTYGHGGIFPALSIDKSVEDLKTSIEKLGGNASALAYPYGDCTDRTKQAVQKAGIKLAFTTVNKKVKPGMNKYELPRVRISSEISIKGFSSSL